MNTLTDPMREQDATPHATAKASKSGASVMRVLAAIDGRESGVIRHLLTLHALGVSLEVTMLNVQPEPQTWRLRGYGWFKREEIRDRLINDVGRSALVSAGRQLDNAGIAHKDRVALGGAADSILQCAREEKCDLILLAEKHPGVMRQWLLRSVAVSVASVSNVVVGLAHVPVVVAK
jgi:nucleotide-binding universal stress UspA family protein